MTECRRAYSSRRRWGNLAVAIGLVAALPAKADNDLPRCFFDTRAAAGYGDPTRPLRALMRNLATNGDIPRVRGIQHFCAIGYDDPDWRFAEVHWREGRRLILWEATDAPEDQAETLAFSRRILDLTRDVVADTAAVNGSTYLVTRAWVRQVLADCAAHGRRFTVAP